MRSSGSVSPELNLKFFMTKSSSTISGGRNCVGACSTSETSNAAIIQFSFRRTSPQPYLPRYRCDDLRGVEANSLLEHRLDLANIRDRRRWIAVDDHEVRLLADHDRSDAFLAAKKGCAVERADPDRLERREARFDQQLQLALIRIAGNHAAATRGIRSREQHAARFREGTFQREPFRKQRRVGDCWFCAVRR